MTDPQFCLGASLGLFAGLLLGAALMFVALLGLADPPPRGRPAQKGSRHAAGGP